MLVPTLYSLAQDGTDILAEIFPQYVNPDDPTEGEYPYWSEKRNALWNRFHDTGIGNPDTEYWVRCMSAKAAELDTRYLIRFRVYAEYKARVAALTAVDLSDGSLESSSTHRTYDPPEVSVQGKVAEDYLADQTRTDFEQKSYGGTDPASVGQYMDDLPDPYAEYAREFDKLFYWGL